MIYIQSNSERTLAHHFDCSCALYGAIDSGFEYRLTSFEEVSSGKYDLLIKNKLFVGSVEFMREVFNRINITEIKLPRNSNRKCEIITLSEAHKIAKAGKEIFIKSVETKLISGLVLNGMTYTCLNGLPDDTLVMAYEVFKNKIISEWRIYVHNNSLLDARNYSGNFMISPNYDYVKTVLQENTKDKFPCAYTIDIGILENGENVVIEFNDMWAIGNYGIPNDLYLRALKDRYFEIIKK